MKKVIRLTESDLTRIVKRVIEEQSKGNPFKEQIANLISDINQGMSWDFWRDADDLMVIYNKLLPLKGKMVNPPQISRYIEMDAQEQKSMPALHYFNMMYGRIPNNKYGMGSADFISRVKQIGDKTITGNVEKTKDGKYTTQKLKHMIIDLITKG